MEGPIMKRISSRLLAAATLAVLSSTMALAGPPTPANRLGAAHTTAADAPDRTARPPAPELWSFRVEYRSRRSPQFPWGSWRHYATVWGDYNIAKQRATNLANFIEGRSKNLQARILERRIR
jgi:hypothetical protein